MTPKRIATTMTVAAILFSFTSLDETHARSHNKPRNSTQLARDTQLLLSLYNPLVGLDGRCGPQTAGAIETHVGTPAEKPSGTACRENVLETLKHKIRSAIMRDKLSGSTPFNTADIQSLSSKIDVIKDDVNKKLEDMATDINHIKSGLKAATDSLNTHFPTDNDSSTASFVTAIAIGIMVILSGAIYIRLMINGGTYLFGAPIREEGKIRCIKDINERFTGHDPDAEAAVAYLNNITDRIIAKAVGLLQYNAVVLAITYVISYSYANKITQLERIFLSASIICSMLSTVCVILVLFTHWRKSYLKPWEDVAEIARLCMGRSIGITIGLTLGYFSVLCDMAFYLHTMLTH